MKYAILFSTDSTTVDNIAARLNSTSWSLLDPQPYGTADCQLYNVTIPDGYSLTSKPTVRMIQVSTSELFDPLWIGHKDLDNLKRDRFKSKAISDGAIDLIFCDSFDKLGFINKLIEMGHIAKIDSSKPDTITVTPVQQNSNPLLPFFDMLKRVLLNLGILAVPVCILGIIVLWPKLNKAIS